MTSAPISRWQSIVQQVSTTENKALLWSLLSEENVFTGLNEQSIQPVITLFETAIHTTVNGYLQNQDAPSLARIQTQNSQSILSELNKDVIKRVIHDIIQYRTSSTPSASSSSSSGSAYKSADIQEARIRDITSKVKVLENDMNSFLVLKKPPEINFADKNVDDDVPIGDNMDQLIRDALATRARELEVIQFDIPPPPPSSDDPITDSADGATTPASSAQQTKKTVSFDSYPERQSPQVPPTTAHVSVSDTDIEMEIGTIFNKLKRPTPTQQPPLPLPPPTQSQSQTSENEHGHGRQLEELIRGMQSTLQALVVDVQFIKDNMFVYDTVITEPGPE
jgi:hypothetical protein